ncbi:Na+/H+ antiporter subunit A [Virgibacillus alimentarius]|uniref:Multicomponent Na+:H+ antiporter subunit A n=1 Tax=Virgibacillus alimentarius TaxID=698769 RepID=A0ABS4SB50_9BACI|nr:Na+/H+ antiporter subunit A [Virgibacillus alimentarius]MBP2258731.1 multicomponent Na+:H+ antiporter subunit A [Virgibacillus alimentarius]
MSTVNMAIFIPFIAAMLIPLVYKKLPRLHIGWIVLVIPTFLFIRLACYIPTIARGETYLYTAQWIPSFDIYFSTYLDGLSMIFGLLITGVGALVILYSIYYLSTKESLQHFYIYLMLFMGAMLGVVFSDNIMVLYVFWELTSISSFLLIAFWYHRKGSRYGARKSLLITVGGGFAMLVGFIMIYTMTGTFHVREIIAVIGEHKESHLFLPAMLLLLFGAFTKSAQFPFHIWLPNAMEAPTPVSAYLHSATMVKAGIYLVARFTPVFGGEAVWFWLISGVGLFTLFWGSFCAIRQTDLKALLAYSTVSQLGMIMCLFGIGSASLHMDANIEAVLYTQATFAALFHLINHSTFKGALFMVVGIVDYRVGTRDIRKLGGLMAFMPISFTVAVIGSFSMAGLPPFNGFLSKEMFFTAVLHVRKLDIFAMDTFGILFPVIAWIASCFTFIYCMIIVWQTFFGPYRREKLERKSREASPGMLIAPVTLALFVVGIFFFPNVLGDYILKPAMASVFPSFQSDNYLRQPISPWHGFNTELMMTIGILIIGTLLYMSRRYWKGIYNLVPDSWTLDNLYNNTLTQMEAGSSFITSFYMTGYLRHYLLYMYVFFILAVGGVLVYTGAFDFHMANDAPINSYEWMIAGVVFTSAIAILFAKSRLTSIILNGVIGYAIAVFFVLFRAPDLALTQIVVETVTTALFLLCFYFLPPWRKENAEPRSKRVNLVISIAVGLVFILVALSVKSGKLFDTIAVYFENADELAGGNNIVNTILADFRAFDTMLEVIVLLIAGIGVFSLIRLKAGKGAEKIED